MLFEKIKNEVLFQLEKFHLNLSHLYEIEKSYFDSNSFRNIPEAILTTLRRKNLMAETSLELTSEGKKLYELLSDPNFSSNIDVKKEVKKVKEEQNILFKEWIEIYPTTASWTTPSGTYLESSRPLRQNNVGNEKKYLAILAEGVYTHEDMKNALLFQIEKIKKESIYFRENKMVFMQGTEPYLNQRTFENFIIEMKRVNWKPDPTFNKINNDTIKRSDILLL